MTFLFVAKKYSLIVNKVQICKHSKKIILKCFVLSVALARCKGHNCYEKNVKKNYNCRIKVGMCKCFIYEFSIRARVRVIVRVRVKIRVRVRAMSPVLSINEFL